MKHFGVFEGIGGFSLAARWMGWETVGWCEIDKYCQAVLRKNFPEIKKENQHGDIKETDFTQYAGRIDILTGGPPCQPASLAGKRKGTKDYRWLWPDAIRATGEIKPRFAVFENPDDLLTLENGSPFEGICRSLEGFGYKVETYGIPAACVEAWHERDRIWIIAYTDDVSNKRGLDSRGCSCEGRRNKKQNKGQGQTLDGKWIRTELNPSRKTPTNFDPSGLEITTRRKLRSISKENGTFQGSEPCRTYATNRTYRQTEPGVVRMVHGIPNRVDRIKTLGNTIDPYIALEIFKAIDDPPA